MTIRALILELCAAKRAEGELLYGHTLSREERAAVHERGDKALHDLFLALPKDVLNKEVG